MVGAGDYAVGTGLAAPAMSPGDDHRLAEIGLKRRQSAARQHLMILSSLPTL